MRIESIGFSDIYQQEILGTNVEDAKKKLFNFGLETSQENIEAIIGQQKVKQHPTGYKDVLNSLDDPDELKRLMGKKGIKSIVHSEGLTVWDHVKTAIQEIESMNISNEDAAALKIIMLYHDLGKTIVGHSEKNIEQTKNQLKKGIIYQAMISHHKERLTDIEMGFRSNGVEEKKLKKFMVVVKNHMNTSILEQTPKKIVELFEEFGNTDEEIKEVVKLLTLVFQIDGNATKHIDLVDGELKYSKNEKKLKLDFNSVWEKYEEGKKILKQEKEKKKKKEVSVELEISIFGKKLSEYLIQDRKIKPGQGITKSIGIIKDLIIKNKNLSVKEIRKLINEIEL